MMGLYFLVLLTVGMLRPIRNTLALDGLGETDFYKVYIVSALVIVFVPILNRLSDYVPWRRLIPAVALFFALNLLVFRALYVDGSTVFGLVFYGWYDLFAAALVTQLFMVTQLFFHARLARHAYPLVIAGGSLGATMGGGITGFTAQTVGTPNLMLVAAALLGIFSLSIVLVWSIEGIAPERPPKRRTLQQGKKGKGDGLGLQAIFSNRQVLLITSLVLITILVKQLVDYQFNTITKEVFVERDAIGAFQGKFGLATDWLPILVLLAIGKPLKRWGVGVAVLILPVAMVLGNAGLLLFWGLATAVIAKGADKSFRYSAERTGREILYVPVPDEIKLKAKAYIDVAVEKGLGKILSAGLIFVLLTRIDHRQVAWAGVVLALLWIVLALAVRREYTASLAASVRNRFASLRGVFASVADQGTLSVIREALAGDDRQVAFALDLVDQAPAEDARHLAGELQHLLEHPLPAIRRRALRLLERAPGAVDEAVLQRSLQDPEPEVREAAVRTLVRVREDEAQELITELLQSEAVAVRTAVLTCLARGEIEAGDMDLPAHVRSSLVTDVPDPDPEARMERALVAAALRPPSAVRIIDGLLEDPDERVARAALRSAGLLGEPLLYPRMVSLLGRPGTRDAAREALAAQGLDVLPVLTERLLDPSEGRTVRRHIPSVLARIPHPDTVEALIRCVIATETDQILDFRAIKALSKLRARNPDLVFDPVSVRTLLERSLDEARDLLRAREALADLERVNGARPLLQQALNEAWEERREEVFRCLGLIHPPDDVHRCYLAVVRGETVSRANALEWLENTVRYHAFEKLAPILEGSIPLDGRPGAAEILRTLQAKEDRWIARLAERVAWELRSGPGSSPTPSSTGGADMDLIEVVFLLQQVDVLRDARSDHLSLLASITEEVDADTGTVLVRAGEPADALHVVVRGEVRLKGTGTDLTLTDGRAFGTWALIDAVPSPVEARASKPTRLLRLGRADFLDLLSDYPELAIGMLQGLAQRFRALVT
jgi:ATP:ADP antiporter, AAA family